MAIGSCRIYISYHKHGDKMGSYRPSSRDEDIRELHTKRMVLDVIIYGASPVELAIGSNRCCSHADSNPDAGERRDVEALP